MYVFQNERTLSVASLFFLNNENESTILFFFGLRPRSFPHLTSMDFSSFTLFEAIRKLDHLSGCVILCMERVMLRRDEAGDVAENGHRFGSMQNHFDPVHAKSESIQFLGSQSNDRHESKCTKDRKQKKEKKEKKRIYRTNLIQALCPTSFRLRGGSHRLDDTIP